MRFEHPKTREGICHRPNRADLIAVHYRHQVLRLVQAGLYFFAQGHE
jgi:hypothetical protein